MSVDNLIFVIYILSTWLLFPMDLNSNEQINKEISSSESETENEHPVINDSENIEMIRSKKSKYHVIGRSRSNIWQLYSNATECRKLKAAV